MKVEGTSYLFPGSGNLAQSDSWFLSVVQHSVAGIKQTLFIKSWIVNALDFVGQLVSVAGTPLCHCNSEPQTNIKEHSCVLVKLYSQKQVAGWIWISACSLLTSVHFCLLVFIFHFSPSISLEVTQCFYFFQFEHAYLKSKVNNLTTLSPSHKPGHTNTPYKVLGYFNYNYLLYTCSYCPQFYLCYSFLKS